MTTTRDAIGLSERLRDGSDNWLMSDSAREEIATQLDALHKELAQTQAHLAIRNGDLAEAVRERDSIQERVKELEAELVDTQAALVCVNSDWNKAQQERDEAYERLKPFAFDPPVQHSNDDIWTVYTTAGEVRAARDLVRRLVAGTEKEGK